MSLPLHAADAAPWGSAQSLTAGGIIEFRMCIEDATGHGLEPGDIHGFVSRVPMGDAEIIRPQHEGYGYMR